MTKTAELMAKAVRLGLHRICNSLPRARVEEAREG